MLGNIRLSSGALLRSSKIIIGKRWFSDTIKHTSLQQGSNCTYDLSLYNLPLSLHHVDKPLFHLDKTGGQFRLLMPSIKDGVQGLKEIEYDKLIMKVYTETEATVVVIARKGMVGFAKFTSLTAQSRKQMAAQLQDLSKFWAASTQTGFMNLSNRIIVILRDKESLPSKLWSGATSAVHSVKESRLLVLTLPQKIKEQRRALYHASSQRVQTGHEMVSRALGLVTEWYTRRVGILKRSYLDLFETPTKSQQKDKEQKSEPSCEQAKTADSKKPPQSTSDLIDSVNKKWVSLREKLPGLQSSIASNLQKIQDFVNKKIQK